jgi:hypothetical protein
MKPHHYQKNSSFPEIEGLSFFMEIVSPQSHAGKRVTWFVSRCPAGESQWPHGDECRDEKNNFPVRFAAGGSGPFGGSSPEFHGRPGPCRRFKPSQSRRKTEDE